jgi:DeoR family ulaG and ulaABCDEF operon transcriptional repressor
MHEKERHKVILAAVESRPVVTVTELVSMTSTSEATIRRDIATLHLAKQVRRVRGGVESITPPPVTGLAGRPLSVNKGINASQKQAIANAAAELCEDGESIIINGGSTTFNMVYPLATRRLQILTNSMPIAQYLLYNSKNTITLPGGTIYREQDIILSPFENDISRHFHARRMFMGAQAIGPLGIMEADPQIIQAEQRLIEQTDELIVLADSSKFDKRSGLIITSLERVHTVITDENISDSAAAMLEKAEVQVIAAPLNSTRSKQSS